MSTESAAATVPTEPTNPTAACRRRTGPARAAGVFAAASLLLAVGCSSGGDGNPLSAGSRAPTSGGHTAVSEPATPSSRPPSRGPNDYPVNTAASVPGSTRWKQAHQRGQLVIGITHAGAPHVAEEATGLRYTGFDIEIASMVAADLGFGFDQVRVLPGPVMDFTGGQMRWPTDVDISVGASWLDTGDGTQPPYLLSTPYYMNGFDLLVAKSNHAITGTNDPLAGRRLCVTQGEENQDAAKKAYPQAVLTPQNDLNTCEMALLNGSADAVFGPDLWLRGFAAARPDDTRLVGPATSPVATSLAVPTGETALRDAINAALRRHIANGDWQAAYQATLGPSGAPATPPPAG